MSPSRARVRILLCLTAVAVVCQTAVGSDDADRRQLFASTVKGCVAVMTSGGPASGCVVDVSKRWVVTCQHVVGAREEVEVFFPSYRDGRLIQERHFYLETATRLKGKVLSNDLKRDLCLIQLDSLPEGTLALPIAPASGQPGEQVNLIGNPAASGALWNYATGTLRAVYQKKFVYRNTAHEVDALVGETQLPANPGDSGAAVFNDRGEVLGIHSGGTPDGVQLMATYIDVRELRAFLAEPFRLIAKLTSFDDFFNAGNDFFKSGEIDKAIDAYTKAINLKPDQSDAWRCRASAYIRKRLFEKAIEDCNQAISVNKSNAKAYNERAVCHGAKGDLQAALVDYNEAVRLSPGDPMFWAGRAWTFNSLKEYTRAISDSSEAIRLKRDFALPYSERGLAHFSLKEYDLAKKDFDESITLSPTNAQAWLRRSRCNQALGNDRQATDDYNEAVRLNPAIVRPATEK
jgi:tetratricopeptide (TPR) repeat protein